MTATDIRDNEKMRRLYAHLLTAASNCVDVGAHGGDFLRLFSQLAPFGRHIGIEPLPDYSARLRRNFPQVQIEETALSNRCGTADFTIVDRAPAWSGLKQSTYPWKTETKIINVRLSTLDSLLPVDYRPDLVKIDVEGAELEVFQGAVRTLTLHRPYLVFEHFLSAYKAYGLNSAELWTLLVEECKYRIFDLDGNGPLSMQSFSQSSDSGDKWNFVAHE